MRTSFRRGGLTSWPGIGRPSLGGACGKEGLQLTATEFRLSLLHHLKVKFSSHGRRSQSTINRDGELFAWTPLPHDAVEKPRPLGPARCSWGYCTWGRRANKVGETPPPHFFSSSFFLMFKEFAAVCCIPCVCLGKPGRPIPLIRTEYSQETLEFYVTFRFENKKWQSWNLRRPFWGEA